MKFIKRFGCLLFCSDISDLMYIFKLIIKFFCYLAGLMQNNINDKFIKEFKKNVLSKSNNEDELKIINKFRISLLKNKLLLSNEKHGAGSRIKMKKKTISNMVNCMSVARKTGKLLYNLVQYQKPDVIFELGTAFGISTLYMSLGCPSGKIISIEGNMQLAILAEKNFSELGIKNISVIKNSFDEVLPQLKIASDIKYLVFIDGNHTFEATLRYFKKFAPYSSIIIFDDITWSSEMIDAWNEIKKSPISGTTVDLFNMGIVFPSLKKSNYMFWY